MDSLCKGDILLYSGKSWVGKAIRFITRSQWSHSAWVLTPKLILEADWNGVQVSPITKYHLENCQYIRLNLPKELSEHVVDMALEKAGMKYDWKLFFGLFFSWLKGLLGLKSKSDKDQWHNGYICSELVAKPLLRYAGMWVSQDKHLDTIVPEDLWQMQFTDPPKAVLLDV